MLVTFNSTAAGKLSYFEEIAKQLLKFCGHSGNIPGAFKAEEITQALENLQNCLNARQNPAHLAQDSNPDISIYQRAIPLLNLLKKTKKYQCSIQWQYQ